MKRRPARGMVLSKPFNSTYMPPLDSLTVLRGQQLTVDCPRFVSAVTRPDEITVVGKEEEVIRSTKLLELELPPLRLKAANISPNLFPFMKVELAVGSSLSGTPVTFSTHRTSEQTARGKAADNNDVVAGYNKQRFLDTASCSSVPGGDNLSFPGSRDHGYIHRDGLHYQEGDPQRLLSGTGPHLDATDACTSQSDRGPSHSLTEGHDVNTSSYTAADNCGDSWPRSLEGDVMGKNKAATKRQPSKYNSRLPAAPPSPIKTSQLGPTKAVSLSQSPRPVHKPKVKVPATALPASRSQRSSKPKEKVEFAEYLPVSGPGDDLCDLDLVEETMRSSIKKKERRNRKTGNRDEDLAEPRRTSSSPFIYSKRGSLTYSDGSEDSDDDKKSDISDISDISTSAHNRDLPMLNANNLLSRTPRVCQVVQALSATGTPKRGTQKRDKDYEEEQRRQQLADQRRRKQQHIYNKLRSKPWQFARAKSDSNAAGHTSFDNYDFLARYCILNPENTEAYRQIFDQMDEQRRGWLSQEQTATALKEVNSKLTGAEQEFLFRIMEMTGYNVTDGADFRLFATLAALSQKISSLDSWMRLLVQEMNFQLLEMKTFLCKRLWEVCVDPNTSYINLDHLMVELRSGGISRRHQEEVKKN